MIPHRAPTVQWRCAGDYP